MGNKIDIRTLKTADEVFAEWMKNPKFVKEWRKIEPEFEIAKQVIGARLKKKMSQAELAKKAKTGQAVISRIEGANASPSLSLLKRIATALGTPINIKVNF